MPSRTHRVELAGETDSRALLVSLKTETARVRALAAECRRAGVFLEDFPEELDRSRSLLREAHLDAALDHMREIRVDLLGRLLLFEPGCGSPRRSVGPPPGMSLSEEEVAAVNERIARIQAAAARLRLTPHR